MTLPDGSELELNMISTMGNGYTFPLQTMLFAGVIRAACRTANVPFERPFGSKLGNFGVYGDDIICRSEILPLVLRLLKLLGFEVNSEKSFIEGPFRESCGGDFYKGHNVRGVFVKRLKYMQDAYVVINALNRWTAQTGIALFQTVQYLMGLLDDVNRVPLHENDDAGIKCYRRHMDFLVKDKHVQSVKYRRYEQVPRHIKFMESGSIWHPLGSQKAELMIYNPDGLEIAFLAGYIPGGKEGVRHNIPQYRRRSQITPFWDYLDPTACIAHAEYCVPLGMAISINTGW